VLAGLQSSVTGRSDGGLTGCQLRVDKGECSRQVGDACPLGGFGFGEAVGFLLFEEGFQAGLQFVGKAKQAKVADWLKVDGKKEEG
jgi:hypothetical protein